MGNQTEITDVEIADDPLVREMAERVTHLTLYSGEAVLMALCEKASCNKGCEQGCENGCQSSCKTGNA